MVGAGIAGMSVQWTVRRAGGCGVWKETRPFARPAKGGATCKSAEFPAFWEAVLGSLLVVGAVVILATNYKQIRELHVFAAVLLVARLPFLAALALALFGDLRVHEFTDWRTVEATVC